MIPTEPIAFPSLTDETFPDGGRVYIKEDGTKYPSVTTVLSKLKGEGFLKEWRDRVGEDYARRYTTQAANRGSQVHAIYEDYVQNILKDKSEYNPLLWYLFSTSKPFLDKHLTKVHNLEVALHSDRLKIAGRCDLVCEWDNVPTILDYKTSRKEKRKEWIEDYFVQTALYAMMVYELTGIKIKQLVIFMVLEESPIPQIFVEKTEDWIGPAVKKVKEYYEKFNSIEVR